MNFLKKNNYASVIDMEDEDNLGLKIDLIVFKGSAPIGGFTYDDS